MALSAEMAPMVGMDMMPAANGLVVVGVLTMVAMVSLVRTEQMVATADPE